MGVECFNNVSLTSYYSIKMGDKYLCKKKPNINFVIYNTPGKQPKAASSTSVVSKLYLRDEHQSSKAHSLNLCLDKIGKKQCLISGSKMIAKTISYDHII